MKISKHIKYLGSNSNYIYTIAEIGINHNGNLETALSLIKEAHKAGVDAVKFQKRDLEELYTDSILNDHNSAEWTFEYLLPILKESELSKSDYKVIKECCNQLCLELIITPFDLKSADFCNNLDVDAFKIGSADMINYELIKRCASYGKPMIVSTGMWTSEEIEEAVKEYKKIGVKDFFILLANSTYPTPYESINLGYLKHLKQVHPLVGYSGHERGTFIPVAAAALGARVIEKHITLDRSDSGPDHKASMLPGEFKEMVDNLRKLSLSLGEAKVVNQAEKLAKETFAKSSYVNKDLKAGDEIGEKDLYYKSPGKGLFLHEISEFIGKRINCDIKKDSPLTKAHFEELIQVKDWNLPKFSKDWGVKCRFHDFEEYKTLKSPVIEFHCSQKDLDVDFRGGSKDSQLVIHAPEIFDRKLVDICSNDKQHVKDSIEILQKAIDKTIKISSNFKNCRPKFVVHLGGMSLDEATGKSKISTMMERAVENFEKLNFNPDDIEVLPENLPPRPWYLGGQWFQYGFMHADDMVSFCNHFNLKMTYDVCHAALHCNHDFITLEEYTEKVFPMVSHLHLSDALGIDGEGVQIGEGSIAFQPFFEKLKNNKNQNFSWVTEIWSGHVNHGTGCRHSMHSLARYNNII